jgi:general secretion pathway protein D
MIKEIPVNKIVSGKKFIFHLCCSLFIVVAVFASEIVAATPATVSAVTTADELNVRQGPGKTFKSLIKLPKDTMLTVVGRNADSSWLQIQIPGTTDLGWISKDFVNVQDDVSSLSVEEATPAAYAEEAKATRLKEEKITLNFVDVELPTVIKFISEMTGKNFIYDERIRGKITIVAPSKFSAEEVFNLFTSVLELKGFTVIKAGAAYKIIPSSMVKQSSTGVFKAEEMHVVNETYIARLIPLTFLTVQEVMPILQPLISRDGYISAFGTGNAILILDTAQNIEKILDIVKLVDTEQTIYPPEIVYVKYASAETILQVLKQGGLSKKKGLQPRAGATPTAQESINFIADVRLNAIILFGPPEDKEEYKRFIALLDVSSPETSSKINVYYLENADAVEISKVLEGLARQAPPAPGAGAPLAPSGPITSEFTGRIFITPDKATNSLIILASPADYQNLLQVVKKLDRRPKQVFVEAMITEVSINKALDLGTKWRLAGTQDGKPVVIGGVGTINTSTVQDIMSGLAGLTIGGVANFVTVPVTRPDGTSFNLNAPGFAALFSLEDFKGAVDVLSTPHILTSDNKEAEIIVGENVPFLSKLERETTTTNQPILQSIERKDVGITLKIKPQISEGDYVKLDIYQEISALVPTATSEGLAITTKRSAKTSVVVRDKQTVVIGGLIQNKETKSITKVPLLGDIPLLGWLFKFSSTNKEKTNLLIYLTPTIVRDFSGLDKLKDETEIKFKNNTSEKPEKTPDESKGKTDEKLKNDASEKPKETSNELQDATEDTLKNDISERPEEIPNEPQNPNN